MSSSMYNLLEAYSAVYNPDVKEDLDLQKDYISEMQIGNLTKSDLVEIAEEVVEIMLSSGISIKESQKIVGSLFTKSDITGRQQKIDRLQEAFASAFRELTSKASNTAVEEFGKYRNSKKLQESWSARFNQDKRVERVHNRLVAEEIASTKELLILMIEEKDDSYLETDMKKRAKNNEKALADMKTTKAHKDMVGAARKAMGIGEALDPVGEEDDDIDNDGDSDSSDKYLKKRRKAISKAMGKKKKGDDEELDEAMRPGPRQRKVAAKVHDPYIRGGSQTRSIAHNVAVRNDGPGTPGYEKRSTGGKGARYAGYGDQGAGNKARRRAGQEPLRGNRDPRNEEFDIFDVVLEFLYVEGYAETLEEAEWMMGNIIDEEAINIILDEGLRSIDTPEKAQGYALRALGSATKAAFTKDKKTFNKRLKGLKMGQRKAERKAANEEFVGEDSRRMSNKQHTARVRSNIKSFGSNYTPPSNYDPDANRGQGEVLTRKQIEKKRRKSLRQEEFVNEADSLAAMQARRERRLKAQRKREGTTATGRDFGRNDYLSSDQQKARRDAEFKAGTKKEEFEFWVNALVEEGYDLSDYTWDEMYEFYLDEELTGERLKRAETKIKSLGRRKSTLPSREALSRVSIGKEGTGVQGGRKGPVKRGGGGTAGRAKVSGTGGDDMDRGSGNKAVRRAANEEFEAWLDEAMTNYEKNRKRAAQRKAARNEARRQGKTGAVPGVGYVTPRMERETWTDESGKTRHAKGL